MVQASTHPDVNAFRDYLRHQFIVLIDRHAVEQAMLVKVLCEEYQRAAMQARDGSVGEAASAMSELAEIDGTPADPELRQALNTVALPAQALVAWLTGDRVEARRLLHRSLDDCAALAARGHTYLTGRQLHLALNIARLEAEDDADAAAQLTSRVADVAAGDATRWPFAGADDLRIPLSSIDRAAIDGQVARLRVRLSGDASGAAQSAIRAVERPS
jgi:hypothetical protein